MASMSGRQMFASVSYEASKSCGLAVSFISMTTQKLIHIPISSLRPRVVVCMMKIHTDHVDVM